MKAPPAAESSPSYLPTESLMLQNAETRAVMAGAAEEVLRTRTDGEIPMVLKDLVPGGSLSRYRKLCKDPEFIYQTVRVCQQCAETYTHSNQRRIQSQAIEELNGVDPTRLPVSSNSVHVSAKGRAHARRIEKRSQAKRLDELRQRAPSAEVALVGSTEFCHVDDDYSSDDHSVANKPGLGPVVQPEVFPELLYLAAKWNQYKEATGSPRHRQHMVEAGGSRQLMHSASAGALREGHRVRLRSRSCLPAINNFWAFTSCMDLMARHVSLITEVAAQKQRKQRHSPNAPLRSSLRAKGSPSSYQSHRVQRSPGTQRREGSTVQISASESVPHDALDTNLARAAYGIGPSITERQRAHLRAESFRSSGSGLGFDALHPMASMAQAQGAPSPTSAPANAKGIWDPLAPTGTREPRLVEDEESVGGGGSRSGERAPSEANGHLSPRHERAPSHQYIRFYGRRQPDLIDPTEDTTAGSNDTAADQPTTSGPVPWNVQRKQLQNMLEQRVARQQMPRLARNVMDDSFYQAARHMRSKERIEAMELQDVLKGHGTAPQAATSGQGLPVSSLRLEPYSPKRQAPTGSTSSVGRHSAQPSYHHRANTRSASQSPRYTTASALRAHRRSRLRLEECKAHHASAHYDRPSDSIPLALVSQNFASLLRTPEAADFRSPRPHSPRATASMQIPRSPIRASPKSASKFESRSMVEVSRKPAPDTATRTLRGLDVMDAVAGLGSSLALSDADSLSYSRTMGQSMQWQQLQETEAPDTHSQAPSQPVAAPSHVTRVTASGKADGAIRPSAPTTSMTVNKAQPAARPGRRLRQSHVKASAARAQDVYGSVTKPQRPGKARRGAGPVHR